jgi:hypothetical protein
LSTPDAPPSIASVPRIARPLLLVVLIATGAAFGVGGTTAAPAAAKLSAVWLEGGRVHATYRVPIGMQAYGLSFSHKSDPTYPVMLLPGTAEGAVTPSAYTSTHLIAENLTSTDYDKFGNLRPTTYMVRLLYGPKSRCGGSAAWNYSNLSWNGMLRCRHFVSNTVPLTVGQTIGPGSLVQSASGSGDFASASVSANVKSPNQFTVRVASSPSGRSVHVTWNITCTKGYSVKGASGSWDDVSPVSDDSSITVPFATLLASPDSCIIAVGASLQADTDSTDIPSGTITVRLYVDKSHL